MIAVIQVPLQAAVIMLLLGLVFGFIVGVQTAKDDDRDNR